MLPQFPEFSAYAFLMDFFYASILLLIGYILRMNIRLFQNLFIPSSVIAGIIGLLLGPEFLDVIKFSTQAGMWPSILIIILFATIMLGHEDKKESLFKRVWATRGGVFTAYLWEYFQFGIAILAGYFLVHAFFPDVHDGIGMTMSAGFAGGYGYGGAVGTALEGYGLKSGTGVGMTFATLGMLVGILGGMILINIASRKGYLTYTKRLAEIPEDELRGLKDMSHPESIGTMTVNSNSIDPLGFHVVLVFIASGLAYLTNYYVKKAIGADIPALCLALIWGLIIQRIAERVGFGKRIDKQIVTRIGSTVTDFLVFFGFVTISKEVIVTYLPLIILLALIGTAINVFVMMAICPRTLSGDWFEKGIIWFGTFSGVAATGVTLLRIVDPEFESSALEDFGVCMALMSFSDLILIGVGPVFLGTGHTLATGIVVTLISAVFLVLLKATKVFHPSMKK